MTARHAIAFREVSDGPTRVLIIHPKSQCQSQNARAKAKTGKRDDMMKLTAIDEVKADKERARVSQYQAAGFEALEAEERVGKGRGRLRIRLRFIIYIHPSTRSLAIFGFETTASIF